MALEHLKYQNIFEFPILLIAGPSGAGKGTLITNINALQPHYEKSVSCTTRPLDPEQEQEGVDYYSISKEEFADKLSRNEFAETNSYMQGKGNNYGTPWSEFERISLLGKTPALDIDINGILQLVDKKLSRKSTFRLFLDVNEDEQERRLIARARKGDCASSIAKRVSFAREERKQYFFHKQNDPQLFDHYINTSNAIPGVVANDVLNMLIARRRIFTP